MPGQIEISTCFEYMCFAPLKTDDIFFSFSQYLAALALMVLAWTIADTRYKFRILAAPIPLRGTTFTVVSIVGILTLLTDLWRAEEWPVPVGNLVSPAEWQALLGAAFLMTFILWAWYAFIRPPKFGATNAKRYSKALYGAVLKGAQDELPTVADEFALSAMAVIEHATDRGLQKHFGPGDDAESKKVPGKVECYANELLLLIADKRFCRAIVHSAPTTALAIFDSMRSKEKYGVPVESFARNILSEALIDKESFLYSEADGYGSGLLGYHKPLSQAIYGSHRMAEAVSTLLDPKLDQLTNWDAESLEAYCRVSLIVFKSYVRDGTRSHSYTLARAYHYIEQSITDLHELDGATGDCWGDDALGRLAVVVQFIQGAIKVLDDHNGEGQLRDMSRRNGLMRDVYSSLAKMIFEVICWSSKVKGPKELCWHVQNNSVWMEFFNFDKLDGPAGKLVKFKVRRLLYDEIRRLEDFPNFKGASILGFLLNVFGLDIMRASYAKDSVALNIAIIRWVEKNYDKIYRYNPRVGEACLVDGMRYRRKKSTIELRCPSKGLRRVPLKVKLRVHDSTKSPMTDSVQV